jgi:hypothetical protein
VRRRPILLGLALLLALAGCSRKQPQETLNPLDRVDSTRKKPINFLHKTFSVKKYAQFAFEVPAHTVIPRLHGTFKSFIKRSGEDSISDDSADIDFILMNPDQFADFSQGHGDGTAMYTVDPTHDHEVEFLLPPTQGDPAKYYVIFRNSPGGAALKYVEADFSLTFGY